MCTKPTSVPGNVFVDLDKLPVSLNLSVGQNLIFVRAFSRAGDHLLHSLKMPEPCFVTGRIDYGTKIQGQPEATYIAALGLVNSAGQGVITIQFDAPDCGCSGPTHSTRNLPFSITA